MKKALIIIITVAAAFIGITFIFQLTNVLAMYKVPTDANQPAINPGDRIYGSKFAKDRFYKFIAFSNKDVPLSIFRCVGLPGDEIQIKNGVLLRNRKPLNEDNVWNEYIITESQLDKINRYVVNNHYPVYTLLDTTYLITFSKKAMAETRLNLKQYVVSKDTVNEMISKAFPGTTYNEDNFGPVKVPANSYFLLGDSRHNAADSRYIGFVKESDIRTIILNR
ncbi:signal peptidase I [Mucilaginibacter conchicola]|uniref:Signal peptidase I n=1 Tax=Mucilaginibacter conchicola TaxID=2303333 RepID=A0A372NVH4_9SPHI|nr:signal peptidase I [Mucilaginibacter conchicola]RFZ94150.1 signal peptidase I [Mucilaginibacter conchicola]